MKKSWKISLLIAWIFIALEALAIFIFFKPYIDTYRVYHAIDNGEYTEAKQIYDSLSLDNQNKIQDNLNDYSADICQRYIAGKMTYEETLEAFDAINAIDRYGELMPQYMAMVNNNEFRVVIDGIFTAKQKYDNNLATEYNNRLTLLSQRMQTSEKEQILIEMLNQYYQDYLNGMISADKASVFVGLVLGVAYYEAYDYASLIQMNVNHVSEYRTRYTEAQNYFAEEDYFAVMKICKNVCIDPYDEKYQEQYAMLYDDAYALGKLHYDDVLEDYIEAGDKEAAVLLMEKIANTYGSEVDLSWATMALAEDWQIAYVDFLPEYQERLVADLCATELGESIYTKYYDSLKPNSMELYDIDSDGTPELILFNDSQIDKDYIGSFVYRFDGKNCSYVGFANVRSFGKDGAIITAPNVFEREIGSDENCIVWYNGETFNPGSSCQAIGDTYYVDGAEVEELEYMSAKTELLAYAGAYNVGNTKYVSISDGKNFILAYEAE